MTSPVVLVRSAHAGPHSSIFDVLLCVSALNRLRLRPPDHFVSSLPTSFRGSMLARMIRLNSCARFAETTSLWMLLVHQSQNPNQNCIPRLLKPSTIASATIEACVILCNATVASKHQEACHRTSRLGDCVFLSQSIKDCSLRHSESLE